MVSPRVPEYILQRLLRLFYLENSVKKVLLFGSRARNVHRENSDIDIALIGKNIPRSFHVKIREAARIYPIDIVNMETCDNEELRMEIEQEGIPLFERDQHA